jgi:CheY-like chemotaxis protein
MPQRPKVLLADDDRDLLEVLRLVLEGRQYHVVTEAEAARVEDVVERERPDVIVLDVMMPEATEGFHIVWRLRRRPEAYFQDVPIIILSAIHQKTPLRFYPDAGDGTYTAGEFLPVQGFVDKPVEPGRLLEEMQRVLAVTRAR